MLAIGRSILGLAIVLAYCSAQEKWVWNGKTAKAVRTESGQVRYGLYAPDLLQEDRQDYYRPGLRPPPPDLPPLVRPGSVPDYNRPPPPLPPPHRPAEKPELDPTRYQKCKCAHAFNCKSPGLLFGSCDAGKKYCCEKNPLGGGNRDFVPNSEDPEVLAGPGGPVDHLKKPHGVGPRPGGPGLGPGGPGVGLRPGGPGLYGDRPGGPGLYGDRPGGPGLYGDRPSRPGSYGLRSDGSLGNLDYDKPYRPGPRY